MIVRRCDKHIAPHRCQGAIDKYALTMTVLDANRDDRVVMWEITFDACPHGAALVMRDADRSTKRPTRDRGAVDAAGWVHPEGGGDE